MKLNLGSGINLNNDNAALNVITLDHRDWKHIEINEKYPATEHYDITTGIKEKDSSIEEIWMGDFFEHLMRVKAKFVMKECYRVLKSNGRLRMSVPDMQVAMPLWLDWAINGNIPNTPQKSIDELYDCIWGGQDRSNQVNSLYDSHFCGYTERTLKELIIECGFDKNKIERIRIHNTFYDLSIDAKK